MMTALLMISGVFLAITGMIVVYRSIKDVDDMERGDEISDLHHDIWDDNKWI